MAYDPQSNDSVLTAIYGRLGRIDDALARIEERDEKTNQRLSHHDEEISSINRDRAVEKGRTALISLFISGVIAFCGWVGTLYASLPHK